MKKALANLPLARALLLFFAVVLAITILIVGGASRYFEQRSVTNIAEKEARKTSELIFESIYAVMKRGWGRKDIDEVIDGLRRAMPDSEIALYRSPKVAELFGESPHMLDTRDDAPLREVVADGNARLYEEQTTLRFLYPLRAEAKCLGCHVNAELGDINGVIDIRFPVEQLRVPLQFMLDSVFTVFSVIFLIVAVTTYLIVRQVMIRPIVELSQHMREIDEVDHLSRSQHASHFAFRELTLLTDEFHYLLGRVSAAQHQLQDQSERDPLTGLYNRRRMDEVIDAELLRSERYRHSMALFMLDLNRFKPINDEYGHEAGDAVLVAVARVLQGTLRDSDVIARVGGDEFMAIAPETDAGEARLLAARLSTAVSSHVTSYQGEQLQVGISIGVAIYPEHGDNRASLGRHADRAMYEDKQLWHRRLDGHQ